MWWTLFVCIFCVKSSASEYINYIDKQQENYTIAGIFAKDSVIQRNAFNVSSSSVVFKNGKLTPFIIQPIRADSYSAWRELCNSKEIAPVAVFGPQDAIADGAVRDQCFLAQIPHIQAAWQPYDPDLDRTENTVEEETPPSDGEEEEELNKDDVNEDIGEANNEEEVAEEEPLTFKKISINFFPDSDELSIAFARLLEYYRWESFAVLYEDEFGLLRIQKVLSLMTKNHPVLVRRLDPYGDNNKVLKELATYHESRFLLDCHVQRIQKYLNTAAELNILNHYQHFIFASLDSGMVANEEWMLSIKANLTFLSLTKFEDLQLPQNDLASRIPKWTGVGEPSANEMPLESLLIEDVAKHVIQAIMNVGDNIDLTEEALSVPQLVCGGTEGSKWEYGPMVQQEILNLTTMGVTGNVQFDETGKRINYILHVTEKQVKHDEGEHYVFETIARWESNNQLIIDDRNETEKVSADFKEYTFKVISMVAKPYFWKAEPIPCDDDDDDNDCPDAPQYEGFSVDLMQNIVEILNQEPGCHYDFEFIFDESITYGSYNPEIKKWDGIIGALLDKRADLAICDLTITEQRKKVVDFSVPIMSLGISILFVQERTVPPDTFSFLYPYSLEVWMWIGTAYCVVSIVLYVCARISPADWENPQPCDKDPEELENIWNFKNCTWLTMGSIMTQGCDILPKAFGSRWICSMWWFFAVIVCQTYIAQLSASMTSALDNEPINGIEDLAFQTKIRYGAVKNGATLEFFKRSKDSMYQKIYSTLEKNPALLATSNEEGKRRVLSSNGKYAFFMESSIIDYMLKRDCNLKKVGDLLDSKDYAVAMPANSPFRKKINDAVLVLTEKTRITNITKKWWDEMYGAQDCKKLTIAKADDVEGDMELQNLYGLFLLMIIGLVISVFITAAEFLNEIRNIVVREEVSHKEALIKELKASLNFSQSQKPVLRNPSRAPSLAPSGNIELPLNPEEKRERRAAGIENFLDLEKTVQ